VKGQGTLSYDDFSNLSMELRTDVTTSDQAEGRGHRDSGWDHFDDRRTAVDMQNRTLTYMLEGQPAGKQRSARASRPRYWQVDGNL
jgi:hypothetical protein